MKSKCPTYLKSKVKAMAITLSDGEVSPPPSSTGADVAETSGVAAADVPPPTTSDDSDIRRTLDHVLTIQVTQ